MVGSYRIAVVAAFAALALVRPASAEVLIQVDKSAQRMTVSRDGARLHDWPVSTGQSGYDTPDGSYTPLRVARHYFSREWDDAPMPNSIFFTVQGHAIHGTSHARDIGRAVSHGCVRLEPKNARVLFDLVQQAGLANVRVELSGTTPVEGALAQASAAAIRYDGPPRPRRAGRPAIYWDRYGRLSHSFYDDDIPDQKRPPPAQRFFLQQPYADFYWYHGN